jgi:hypothetical protein
MKKSFAQTIFCVIRSRPHQLKDSQMEYHIPAADYSSINVSTYEKGIWVSVMRHCGYTSTHLTREQAEQLRDALIALTTETEDAAQ